MEQARTRIPLAARGTQQSYARIARGGGRFFWHTEPGAQVLLSIVALWVLASKIGDDHFCIAIPVSGVHPHVQSEQAERVGHHVSAELVFARAGDDHGVAED